MRTLEAVNGLVFVLVILCIPSWSTCQVRIDSSSLVFKAKLLVLGTYGQLDKSELDSYLDEQEVTYLQSPSPNIFLFKINSSYEHLDGIKILGKCDFYIAFNLETDRYYKLGGFDSEDIAHFFEDLSQKDAIFTFEFLEQSELDWDCMATYAELSNRKKKKNGYTCYKKCSETFFRKLIIQSHTAIHWYKHSSLR
jgi:hypothetical protein